MDLTLVKRFENRSRSRAMLFNTENHNVQGHGIDVPPGSSIAVDMAVPWSTSSADFFAHHLQIRVAGTVRFWIWQAEHADGDFVRFSTDGAWHDRGEHVHGFTEVISIFDPAKMLLLQGRTIILLDSHFETLPHPHKPLRPHLTVLKHLKNNSNSIVTIFNVENPDTLGHQVVVPPGASTPLDMTIPWATTEGDFLTHHLDSV